MAERGWELDVVAESMMGTALIGAFRHHLDDEFSATASFEFDVEIELPNRKRPPADARVEIISDLGVSYERAYRLWTLASGHPRPSDLALDDNDILGPGKTSDTTFQSDEEVDRITGKLTARAEKALDAAERFTSVETILDRLLASEVSDDDSHQIYAVPLLLAVANRSEEARAAITKYRSLRRSFTHDSEYRAFVTRLTKWMDSGSPLPDPRGPFTYERESQWGFPDFGELPTRPPTPSFWEIWRRSRDRSKKTRAATDAVRSDKAGKSREESG